MYKIWILMMLIIGVFAQFRQINLNGPQITGNTFNPDNTVFVNYTDCNGSPVSTPYTIAGTSFNDICADDTQLITVSYYQDDLSYLTISSFVTQQGNCP